MDFIKETLDWVNKLRAENNIGEPLEDLPKGTPNSNCDCPIAQALCATVSGLAVYHDWHGLPERILLPAEAHRFVAEFDDGELEQYVL